MGVLFVAGLLGVGAGTLVLPLGLIVEELITWPLTFSVGAIFATIGASFTSNVLLPEDRHAAVVPVLALAEGTAALVSIVLLLLKAAGATWSNVILFAIGITAIALTATLAAHRFRAPKGPRWKQAVLMGSLMVLAALIVVVTLLAWPYIAVMFRPGSTPGVQLSNAERIWCEAHTLRVLSSAHKLGLGHDDITGAPATEVIGGEVRFDRDAVREWRSLLPGDYQRACRAAYDAAHQSGRATDRFRASLSAT